MQSDVLVLLDYYEKYIADIETHRLVKKLIADHREWANAKELFSSVRKKTLEIEHRHIRDKTTAAHYLFLEVCLKSFFNQTTTNIPFDECSPYWIVKNAHYLSRLLGLPAQDIADIVAPTTRTDRDVGMSP